MEVCWAKVELMAVMAVVSVSTFSCKSTTPSPTVPGTAPLLLRLSAVSLCSWEMSSWNSKRGGGDILGERELPRGGIY